MPYPYPVSNEELIAQLSLMAHPEGGYYAETMRAEETVPSPFASGAARPIQTSIYYLLTAERPDNYFHMNKSTTMHVHHQGRAEYTLIYPPSKQNGWKTVVERKVMGEGPGELRQLYVGGGVWKKSRLLPEDVARAAAGDGTHEGQERERRGEPRQWRATSSHIGCLITEVVTPGFAWEDHTWLDEATLAYLLRNLDKPVSAEVREEFVTHVRPAGEREK